MKNLLLLILFPIFSFGQLVKVETKDKKKQRLKNFDNNTYRIDSIGRMGISLDNGWKFTFGDNPNFANTDFRDTLKWSNFAIDTPIYLFKELKKNEIGWFRKRIFIDSSLVNQPLLFKTRISGAAEIYLNGKKIHSIGIVSQDESKALMYHFKDPQPYSVSFEKAGEQSIAIRFLFSKDLKQNVDIKFHPMSLGLYHIESFFANETTDNNIETLVKGICIGLFLMMSLIHFFFYYFFRSQRFHSFFSISMLLFSIFLYINSSNTYQLKLESHITISIIKNFVYHSAHIFLLIAIYEYLQQPKKKMFWIVLIGFLVLINLTFFKVLNGFYVILAYTILIIHYIVLIWFAIKEKKSSGKQLRNALLIFVVVALLLFFIFIIFVVAFGLLNPEKLLEYQQYWAAPIIILFLVGPQLSVSSAISFGLAKEFVKTNLSLEYQLKENEKLASEKQEILSKQNEILEHQVNERTVELNHSLSELRDTQNQLIQREKLASLGELTAGIAHEIQNPLNFVNNFSEVSKELIEEIQEERKKEKSERDEGLEDEILNDLILNLEKITHHGKRASNIVKGMLEHSRTSTGEKELTDINALADEYLRLSYHGLRAKDKTFNADFKAEFDENLPKTKAIPQDLGRVLLNLYNNAFQAPSPQRGLKVVVSTQFINNQIIIKVTDNGTGIPESIKSKIFQPFFTTKPTGEGTGLGLSLSYDIITKGHGGTIECESEEGVGTTFIIKLPLN